MATKQSGSTAKKVNPKATSPKKATSRTQEQKQPERNPMTINPKLANPDSILKKYDELIDQLAKVESAQRNKSKPYRIYFVHRKRMEVMKMNFIKSMR